jgi:hypothetical protein
MFRQDQAAISRDPLLEGFDLALHRSLLRLLLRRDPCVDRYNLHCDILLDRSRRSSDVGFI